MGSNENNFLQLYADYQIIKKMVETPLALALVKEFAELLQDGEDEITLNFFEYLYEQAEFFIESDDYNQSLKKYVEEEVEPNIISFSEEDVTK